MKKFKYLTLALVLAFAFESCKDDAWTTDPDLEHVYYVGFYKTGTFSDALNYEIDEDGNARWRIGNGAWQNTETKNVSSDIPFEFHSERVRNYDAVTYFWVTNIDNSNLEAGIDFVIVDNSGKEIEIKDGKYSITWPEAKKGIYTVNIKRLTTKTGALKVNTINPANGTPDVSEDKYIESTRNNITDKFEVRGLTHDFNKVTVTLK